MKALFCLLVSVLIGLSTFAHARQAPNVYMVAKNKVTGTTFTQVVFFNSDEINTLQACETELEYGLTSGWRIFTHLLRKAKGFDYSTHYSCTESDQVLTNWIGRAAHRSVIYQVSINDSQLRVKPTQSYSLCLKEVRAEQGEESYELFCGKSSQKILE